MPHLSLEYSREFHEIADMQALCARLRDAMRDSGVFPLGGLRIRGFAADCSAIADGAGPYLFLDMVVRMGAGRTEADRQRVRDLVYEAARSYLEPLVGDRPCALSLEVQEINPKFSEKHWNTIHGRVGSGR